MREKRKKSSGDRHERRSGTVTTIFPKRGYGFIKDDQDGEDRFFHVYALAGKQESFEGMVIGERVTYMDAWDERREKWTATAVEIDREG